jgi:hypothetical protein
LEWPAEGAIFAAGRPCRDSGAALVLPYTNAQAMKLHLEDISCQTTQAVAPSKLVEDLLLDGAGLRQTQTVSDGRIAARLRQYQSAPTADAFPRRGAASIAQRDGASVTPECRWYEARSERQRPCLRSQGLSGARAALHGTGGDSLCPLCGGLEPAWTKAVYPRDTARSANDRGLAGAGLSAHRRAGEAREGGDPSDRRDRRPRPVPARPLRQELRRLRA